MEKTRSAAPRRDDWASLSAAVMTVEYLIERAAQRRGGAAAKVQTVTMQTAWSRVEAQPAYQWLQRQPAYREALRAHTRWVGGELNDRAELLAAVAYAMEMGHSSVSAESDAPPRRTIDAALRHARALVRMVSRRGAGSGSAEGDAQLLSLLDRYIAQNRARSRAARGLRREDGRQLRFGADVAHLLLAGSGVAPASVVAPLLRLVGRPVSSARVAALIERVKRESRMLHGAQGRASQPVLGRIAIVPTGKARRSARAAE